MRDTLESLVTVGLLVLLVGVLGAAIATSVSNSKISTVNRVQALCNDARLDNGTVSMLECRDLQSKHNLKYICSSSTEDAYCWVEVK